MTFDADVKAKVNSATIDKKLINKKHSKGKEAVLASKEAIELGKKLEKQSQDICKLKDNLHQHEHYQVTKNSDIQQLRYLRL
jgi:hypothetical protein